MKKSHDMFRTVLACLLTAAILLIPQDVWAAGASSADPFASLREKTLDAYLQGRRIAYVISGLGALSIGVGAFFGRFKWSTFFALMGGLFMISIFEQIVHWLGVTSTPFSPSGSNR